MNFCSDCKHGKITEERNGLCIYCIKPAPKNDKALNRWEKKINVRKRLSATACGNFELKEDVIVNR